MSERYSFHRVAFDSMILIIEQDNSILSRHKPLTQQVHHFFFPVF